MSVGETLTQRYSNVMTEWKLVEMMQRYCSGDQNEVYLEDKVRLADYETDSWLMEYVRGR